MIAFTTSQKRPTRFSNENCCCSDGEMLAILERPDTTLTWSDFVRIFSISGCTAAPVEQEYFLPLALEYLRTQPDDGYECLSHIVYFVSSQSALLAADNVLASALAGVRSCFATWTESFIVQHFDLAACRAKGWTLAHDDIVNNSQAVSELISDLLRQGTHTHLAEEFVRSLASEGRSSVQAAWLLEYAREQRRAYHSYSQPMFANVPVDMTPSSSNSLIHGVITDQFLLSACVEQIRTEIIGTEPSPTYWHDTLLSLGLTAA